MKRVGSEWNRWRLGCADLYVEQEVEPRAREGKEEGSALLTLYVELAVKVTAFGLGSGSLASSGETSTRSCSTRI
jgi:hypothetical protein